MKGKRREKNKNFVIKYLINKNLWMGDAQGTIFYEIFIVH